MGIKVMVTGAHTPEGEAVSQALEKGGVVVFRAFTDGSRRETGPNASNQVLRLPTAGNPRFEDAVFAACRSFDIAVVFPVGRLDVSALDLARMARWGDTGAKLMLAAEAPLDECLDREKLSRSLSGVVNTPRTHVLDLSFEPGRWKFPFVVRSRTGKGICFIHEPEELGSVSRSTRLVAQEYLPGEEFSVDVFAGVDGLIQTATVWRRSTFIGEKRRRWRASMDAEVVFLAGVAVRHVDLTMAANVRIRRDPAGRLAVFDINPGFGETLPLTLARGLNLPMMALAQFLKRPDLLVTPHTVRRNRQAAIV